MKLKMLHDYVLIKTLTTAKSLSAGGIILNPKSAEPPCVGEVISVGPGKTYDNGLKEEHNIEVGDIVVFGKSSLNTPLKDEETDIEYHVMKTSDLFGKKL